MSYRLPDKSSWHFVFPIEISEGVQQQQPTGRQIKQTKKINVLCFTVNDRVKWLEFCENFVSVSKYSVVVDILHIVAL